MLSFSTCLSRWNAQILCTVRHYICQGVNSLLPEIHKTSFLFCFCLGEILSDFYVGVTDLSPHDVPPYPHPPSYKLCLYYRGAFERRATNTIACSFPVSGRYVVIQLLSAGNSLSLCEVEVYTGKRLHEAGKSFFFISCCIL